LRIVETHPGGGQYDCLYLGTSDLIVDAIYEGTSQLASDPISRLLPGCGNMGGFRVAGKGQDKQFVALFTTGQEKDWPDSIDLNTCPPVLPRALLTCVSLLVIIY
jgi:hypothetical protein